MDEILKIANDILTDKKLLPIGTNDNLKLCGFSSADMLIFVLKLEKLGFNVTNIAVQNITTVNDIYTKIISQTSDREIV
jgi:acyl carrier protein